MTTIGDAARGSENVFSNFRQHQSRNYSDSRFRAKRCVSDEISKASDLDVGDLNNGPNGTCRRVRPIQPIIPFPMLNILQPLAWYKILLPSSFMLLNANGIHAPLSLVFEKPGEIHSESSVTASFSVFPSIADSLTDGPTHTPGFIGQSVVVFTRELGLPEPRRPFIFHSTPLRREKVIAFRYVFTFSPV